MTNKLPANAESSAPRQPAPSDSVSAVIPCYNAERFIGETIQSALGQSHPPLEIIVVDDGSTDRSAEIAQAFGSPVRVMRQENQGESCARNKGVAEAQGDWVAFLDADDVWKPNKLEAQLAAAQPETIAVHTNYYHFGAADGGSEIDLVPAAERYALKQMAIYNSIFPSSLIVRRHLCPQFPTWTRHSEDLVFSLDLVRRGRIDFVSDRLTGYRVHAASQSKSPDVALKRFQTIVEWLSRNAAAMPLSDQEQILYQRISKLCGATRKHRIFRRWKQYWECRAVLEAYRGHPDVDRILSVKVAPAWLYSIVDASRACAKKLGFPQKPSPHFSQPQLED
jgi:glycosyltransferase involved in cell wall biosynthesis